jgi:hypothetical protein
MHLGCKKCDCSQLLLVFERLNSMVLTLKTQGFSTCLSHVLKTKHCSLKKIRLFSNNIGANGTSALVEALCVNDTVSELQLGYNTTGDRGASRLANVLLKDNILTDVVLHTTKVSQVGAAALANVICTNVSLKHLNLLGRYYDGVTHIVDAQASNMTLQSISVPGSSVEHVNALIASLPHTIMDLAFVLSQEQGIMADIANTLLKAIEQNLSLESFLLISHNPHKLNHQLSDIMKQVEQIVALNRAGRCILSSHTDVGLPAGSGLTF